MTSIARKLSLKSENKGYRKDWSKFNQESFVLDFLDIDWESKLYRKSDSGMDTCYSSFNSILENLVSQYVPTVRVTKRQYKTRKKPWITRAILKSISKRDFVSEILESERSYD